MPAGTAHSLDRPILVARRLRLSARLPSWPTSLHGDAIKLPEPKKMLVSPPDLQLLFPF